jgi:hypothetical protein
LLCNVVFKDKKNSLSNVYATCAPFMLSGAVFHEITALSSDFKDSSKQRNRGDGEGTLGYLLGFGGDDLELIFHVLLLKVS